MPGDAPRHDDGAIDTALLGSPLTLPFSGLVSKNRFMKGAMSERMASWDQHDLSKRGVPSDELIRLYEEWGKADYGIILTGNVMINPIDLEAPGNPIAFAPHETPERIDAFKRLSAAAKQHGCLCIMQVSHAGRQAASHFNTHPVSASDVQLEGSRGMTFMKPTPLTKEGIQEIIEQFVYTAEFAERTGFDGIELHGAHGYLIAQFLANTTNKRTDEYGGNLQSRARFLYEIVTAIRKRVSPTFAVGIKINSVEFQSGGFQPSECAEVCKHLEDLGVDFVELSGGTYEEIAFSHKQDSTRAREAFFLTFADLIRPALSKTKVFVTGGFRTGAAMTAALRAGSTDGIGLGRPACEEPLLPKSLLSGAAVRARVSRIDEASEFGLTLAAAGAQMAQIGRGEVPVNTGDAAALAGLKSDLTGFVRRGAELAKEGIVQAGHVRVTPLARH